MDDLFEYLLARQKSKGGSIFPKNFTDSLNFSSTSEIRISIYNRTKNWDGALYYSTDHNTWTEWDGTTDIVSASNNGWHTIYLRGVGNTKITGSTSLTSVRHFVISGSVIFCQGNCNNLLDYTRKATIGAGAFGELFHDCKAVSFNVTLPSTTLASYCYQNMFLGCTSLETAPDLPAQKINGKYAVYEQMFRGCTNLKRAPKISIEEVSSSCCARMFMGCSKLNSLPALLPKSTGVSCYQQMFDGCSSIKLSTTQEGEYVNEFRIPASGTGTSGSSGTTDMFANTGGTFTGTPTINTTYYTPNTVINP